MVLTCQLNRLTSLLSDFSCTNLQTMLNKILFTSFLVQWFQPVWKQKQHDTYIWEGRNRIQWANFHIIDGTSTMFSLYLVSTQYEQRLKLSDNYQSIIHKGSEVIYVVHAIIT